VKPSNEKHASAARYAKGAADKLNVIDGIAYVVETVEPFSAKQAGYMRAVTAKENNGAYTEGQVVAEFHVNPVNDGNLIESRLCAPGKPAMPAKDGGFRPTGYMEKVSVFLEAQTEPVSKADVQRALGGDANMVARAIDVLGMELYANVKKQGPGKATLCSSVKSFRVATDPGPTPMSEPEYF
jgi:hypothetical protein